MVLEGQMGHPDSSHIIYRVWWIQDQWYIYNIAVAARVVKIAYYIDYLYCLYIYMGWIRVNKIWCPICLSRIIWGKWLFCAQFLNFTKSVTFYYFISCGAQSSNVILQKVPLSCTKDTQLGQQRLPCSLHQGAGNGAKWLVFGPGCSN